MSGTWPGNFDGDSSLHSLSNLPPAPDSLDLSDILNFSTSPHPRDVNLIQPENTAQMDDEPASLRSDSPEPPDTVEITNMREKLGAMGLIGEPSASDADTLVRNDDISPRERILTDMVRTYTLLSSYYCVRLTLT